MKEELKDAYIAETQSGVYIAYKVRDESIVVHSTGRISDIFVDENKDVNTNEMLTQNYNFCVNIGRKHPQGPALPIHEPEGLDIFYFVYGAEWILETIKKNAGKKTDEMILLIFLIRRELEDCVVAMLTTMAEVKEQDLNTIYPDVAEAITAERNG